MFMIFAMVVLFQPLLTKLIGYYY